MTLKVNLTQTTISRGGFEESAQPGYLSSTELLPRTIVVFGVPRGGTTMVAGIAQRCGIDMGQSLPKNLEDQDFVGKTAEQMMQSLAERNQTQPVWGWKYPRASIYLPQLHQHIRNPYYIIVWRDILAAAARGVKNGSAIEDSLQRALDIQAQNMKFISKTSAPMLHVSYEKSIRDPIALARDIQNFTGIHKTFDEAELIAFAEPGTYK